MNTDPAESERYMIFEGVIQWTQAVALQSDRVAAAQTAQFRPGDRPGAHRLPGRNFRSECDYFSVAVDMLFQFKRRATDLGLLASVDFSEIDIVPWQDRVDVRNKRMHVTDYLKPGGEAGEAELDALRLLGRERVWSRSAIPPSMSRATHRARPPSLRRMQAPRSA